MHRISEIKVVEYKCAKCYINAVHAALAHHVYFLTLMQGHYSIFPYINRVVFTLEATSKYKISMPQIYNLHVNSSFIYRCDVDGYKICNSKINCMELNCSIGRL